MSKKGKKKSKKVNDKKQTTLFSFTESSKEKPKIPREKSQSSSQSQRKPSIKPKIKGGEKPQPKEKQKAKELSEKPKKKIPIPDDLIFKGNDTPFGLKEGNFKLPEVKRESMSSKYLRYLIERNEIVTDMERGLLLDVDYDGGQNKAYCKFYDLDTDEIKIWIDTTNHQPYCLSKLSQTELEQNIKLTNYPGFDRIEKVKKIDLLRNKEIEMSKIYGITPLDIGGSGRENIRQIIGSNNAWEANIRYHLSYIYDTGLVPGLIYTIKKGKLQKVEFDVEKGDEAKQIVKELKEIFKDDREEIQHYSEKYLDIFLTPIPDIKRMAMDIEVNMGPDDVVIPDPTQAKQEIISISFVANNGLKLVYILQREGWEYQPVHEKFPKDAKIIFFKEEKDLITETFRLMWQYPVIVTFNGDNFDLNYLYHRANKLKIDKNLNPIQVKRGFGFLSKAECDLRRGIHLDIFNFFFNRSISGYAFGGAYDSASLNAVSAALLGREKYKHEEEIHNMEYGTLVWYNLKDSILTLGLTKFNNNLVWNLIILLCRITKMPIHEMIRRQISTWIQNILYFEHRRNNFLIPRHSEISEIKPGGYSKATIEGKTFQGAYVVPPVPGIHYKVVVMDFACFSDDTEILTNIGWLTCYKLKKQMKNHIKVATVNPNNNNIEYHPVNKLFEYDYNGKMINFKQQGVDILVTPNHRMVYNKRTNERDTTSFENKIRIKTANELKNDYIYAIPYSGNWKGKSKFIQIGNNKYKPSDFLPFLGWFITDGGISGRSVNIYQSKAQNFDNIRKAIKKIGFQYKEYERNRLGKKTEKIFSIHDVQFRDDLKNWFKKNLGKYKRNRIPPEIFSLKSEDLLLLFKSMILGDGKWYDNVCYSFDSLNEDLANDFQILCLKIGYSCKIKKENIIIEIGKKKYERTNYRCLISYERKNIIRKHHTKFVNYQGKVWCVSVNNGTVIARRNGKPFVSGNSLYPSIIKEYNLSYETVQCPHENCKDNLIKGIPYHICTHKMGIFAYIVGFFRDIRVKYFKPKSTDTSLSEERRSYFTIIQQALKVFINGSYGVFGSKNFPLFCLPVAESTTGIGQYSIKATIKKAEELGVKVLYGDTDSVFLLNPSKEQLEQLSQWSKKELDLDLEVEKKYQFLALSERKKNYIGIHETSRYVDLKGLVAKKSNTPEFIKKVFNELIEILKTITNEEEFQKARDEIIAIIRSNLKKIGKPGGFTLEDYAINIGLQKSLNKYDKVIPQHVKAALELKKITGKEYQKGDVISIIKSKGVEGTKALELAKLQDINTTAYKKLLQSALKQVLDALGITWEEIRGVKKMDSFF
ncbi:MAG: DNA polymerase domain-containing protein [Promethearchaeota archaeon]